METINAKSNEEITSTNDIYTRIDDVISTYCASIADCARKVGLPDSTIRSILVTRTEPKYLQLCKFIKTFNINSDWLLFGEGEMTDNPVKVAPAETKPSEADLTICASLTKQNEALIEQNGRLLNIIDKLTNK